MTHEGVGTGFSSNSESNITVPVVGRRAPRRENKSTFIHRERVRVGWEKIPMDFAQTFMPPWPLQHNQNLFIWLVPGVSWTESNIDRCNG